MFELFSSCYWFKFQVFVIFFSSYWFLFVASVVSALSVLKFCSSCRGFIWLGGLVATLHWRSSRSVCLSLSLSASLSVTVTMACHDRGVRWRPCARGPPARFHCWSIFFFSPLNSVQIRFPEMIWVVFLSARRFGLKRFDYVTFCFRARRFGLKRFDYVTFCFRICISGFKICEMIVLKVFFFLWPFIFCPNEISRNGLTINSCFCSVLYDRDADACSAGFCFAMISSSQSLLSLSCYNT